MKKSMVTINWRGKFGKRGLTENACDVMRKISIKTKKDQLMKDVDNLKGEIYQLTQEKVFSLQKEIEIVREYVNVKV